MRGNARLSRHVQFRETAELGFGRCRSGPAQLSSPWLWTPARTPANDADVYAGIGVIDHGSCTTVC